MHACLHVCIYICIYAQMIFVLFGALLRYYLNLNECKSHARELQQGASANVFPQAVEIDPCRHLKGAESGNCG